MFKEDPEFFSNPNESIIVQGENLKKARDDYNTLVSQGNLNKGHHKQGIVFCGENINDNIINTKESTIKSSELKDLDLDFYSINGYGNKTAKVLKIHKNENGIYVLGNNLKNTMDTNFQDKVLASSRQINKVVGITGDSSPKTQFQQVIENNMLLYRYIYNNFHKNLHMTLCLLYIERQVLIE